MFKRGTSPLLTRPKFSKSSTEPAQSPLSSNPSSSASSVHEEQLENPERPANERSSSATLPLRVIQIDDSTSLVIKPAEVPNPSILNAAAAEASDQDKQGQQQQQQHSPTSHGFNMPNIPLGSLDLLSVLAPSKKQRPASACRSQSEPRVPHKKANKKTKRRTSADGLPQSREDESSDQGGPGAQSPPRVIFAPLPEQTGQSPGLTAAGGLEARAAALQRMRSKRPPLPDELPDEDSIHEELDEKEGNAPPTSKIHPADEVDADLNMLDSPSLDDLPEHVLDSSDEASDLDDDDSEMSSKEQQHHVGPGPNKLWATLLEQRERHRRNSSTSSIRPSDSNLSSEEEE